MAFWGAKRRASGPAASPELGFGSSARQRLTDRVERAIELANSRERPIVVSITVPLDPSVDPLERIEGVIGDDQPWSAFIQPARDELVQASIGSALSIEARGTDRFEQLTRSTGVALEAALVDDPFADPDAPSGAGLVWIGGFAFLDAEDYAELWRGFDSARFVLPAASLVCRRGESPAARLTLNVNVEPGAQVGKAVGGVEDLVERLELDAPCADSGFVPKSDNASVSSVAAPEHFAQAVATAASEIREGSYEKIVLAREVSLQAAEPIDPFNALRGLSERFPDCLTFAIHQASRTLLGSSPELLVRREGRRASTMALAGSIRRDADPAVDDQLGEELLASEKNRKEHAIVIDQIERTLGAYSAWVSAAKQPELVKVKNIQHLATPIRAQLTEPRPAIELAGALHPTPAVGGAPWGVVRGRIMALEQFDRGWYTGGVGWMDLLEDGEFHVVLRSALIDGSRARLFAGCGIVGDSEPAAELAETDTKLDALLPVLRVS